MDRLQKNIVKNVQKDAHEVESRRSLLQVSHQVAQSAVAVCRQPLEKLLQAVDHVQDLVSVCHLLPLAQELDALPQRDETAVQVKGQQGLGELRESDKYAGRLLPWMYCKLDSTREKVSGQ